MWYEDETTSFVDEIGDARWIAVAYYGLLECILQNMLFKYSLPKSQMAADPTGNIRSFCSEDALR